jgi:hypothetical protein
MTRFDAAFLAAALLLIVPPLRAQVGLHQGTADQSASSGGVSANSGGSGGGSGASGASGASGSTGAGAAPASSASSGGCMVLTGSSPGIPSYTRLTGEVSANYFGAGIGNVDITDLMSVFGKYPYEKTAALWPGGNGVYMHTQIPADNYVSLQFTVTQDELDYPTQGNLPLYGLYRLGAGDGPQPNHSMTISTRCGDFSPSGSGSTVLPGCWANSLRTTDAFTWVKTATGPGQCALRAGTYYLNVVAADISGVTANGGGSAASTQPQCVSMLTKPGSTRSVSEAESMCTNLYLMNGNGTWIAQTPDDSSSGSGSGGSNPGPTNNALLCSGGTLVETHVDFFSPMPPSCQNQGLQIGQKCSGNGSCPL